MDFVFSMTSIAKQVAAPGAEGANVYAFCPFLSFLQRMFEKHAVTMFELYSFSSAFLFILYSDCPVVQSTPPICSRPGGLYSEWDINYCLFLQASNHFTYSAVRQGNQIMALLFWVGSIFCWINQWIGLTFCIFPKLKRFGSISLWICNHPFVLRLLLDHGISMLLQACSASIRGALCSFLPGLSRGSALVNFVKPCAVRYRDYRDGDFGLTSQNGHARSRRSS